MLTPDQKGSVAEAAIALAAIRLGIGVFKPLNDGERYDLIFDLRSRLIRVQCKSASRLGSVIVVRCRSCRRSADGFIRRPYFADEIDAIAAYCGEVDECYFFPIERFSGRNSIQLRLEPPRNHQRAGLNWAEDFTFEATLDPLRGRSSVGRATGRQPVGQGFESPRLHSSGAVRGRCP
jgi:hypothetical protein